MGAENTGGLLRLHDVNQFTLLKKEAPTQSNEQTTSASSLESLRSASLNKSISENGEIVKDKAEKKAISYKNKRFALSETFDKLGKYTDSEIESIETTKLFQVARSYNDVKKFIEAAKSGTMQKRLFLGKITDETAVKIRSETNIDVKGKSTALSSDDIRHIFARHGENGAALHQGDIAITAENFENIIETLIEPTM